MVSFDSVSITGQGRKIGQGSYAQVFESSLECGAEVAVKMPILVCQCRERHHQHQPACYAGVENLKREQDIYALIGGSCPLLCPRLLRCSVWEGSSASLQGAANGCE